MVPPGKWKTIRARIPSSDLRGHQRRKQETQTPRRSHQNPTVLKSKFQKHDGTNLAALMEGWPPGGDRHLAKVWKGNATFPLDRSCCCLSSRIPSHFLTREREGATVMKVGEMIPLRQTSDLQPYAGFVTAFTSPDGHPGPRLFTVDRGQLQGPCRVLWSKRTRVQLPELFAPRYDNTTAPLLPRSCF